MIFLTNYLLLIILGSFFSLGLHTITRGKWVVLADGSKKKDTEILGAWQLHFEKVIREIKTYYQGEILVSLLFVLYKSDKKWLENLIISPEKKSIIIAPSFPVSCVEIKEIEVLLNVKVFHKQGVFFLYEPTPVYAYSEWVRKMTNCYVCFSGWVGTIFYWTNIVYNPGLIHGRIWQVLLWVFYCISLAFVIKVIKENFSK